MSRLALSALILGFCLCAAATWRTYGHTWDEPEHLAAGMQMLDLGRYEYDTEHPPIAREFIALLPWLTGSHSFGTPPPDGSQEGLDILYDGHHYERTLNLARLGVLPFLALLLCGVGLWGSRVAGGEGGQLLAVLLLGTVPPIIGHGALATLDVPAAATTLTALYCGVLWLTSGGWRHALLFGLLTGIAFATKLSAIPFIGLGMAALLALRRSLALPVPTGALRELLLAATAVFIPIALAFGHRSLELTYLPVRFEWVITYAYADAGLHDTSAALLRHLVLPEAAWDFGEGVMALKAHNDTGHQSYLLGQVSSTGWWYFYLVALAVKTPLPLLATGPVGLAAMAYRGWRRRSLWLLAPPVLFLTLLLFASFFSHINIGVRHVLILYPLLALGGAFLLQQAWRVGNALLRTGAVALVAAQVLSFGLAAPDFLPYFNETVADPAAVLVDSDLDWGQDLRRLERRVAERHIRDLSFAYAGSADLQREPLPPTRRLLPGQAATGWIAINAMARAHQPAGYTWLSAYRPVERIGKTIDLYFIAP